MPEFLHIIWATFLIILFFGGSIFVHEFGHYLAARRRGLKVDRFSIGFGPKLFSWTREGVEWRVSLFPLGGYVALPQLSDLEGIEGDYKSDPKKLPKISYQDTLIVAVMGVVFNMIFAFALATVLWGIGRPSTDSQQTTIIGTVLEKIPDAQGVDKTGPGILAGLQPGDKILSIDGSKVENWRDVKQFVVTGLGRGQNREPEMTLQIERAGQMLAITAHPILSGPDKLRSLGILPQEELFVGQVFPGSPAQKAGIQTGDQILAVNGKNVLTFYDYDTLTGQMGLNALKLTVARVATIAHPQPLPQGGENNIRGSTPNPGTASPQTPSLRGEFPNLSNPQDPSSRSDASAGGGISRGSSAHGLEFTLTPQNVAISSSGEKHPMLGFSIEPKIITVYQAPVEQICAAAALTWRTLATLVHPDSDIKLNHLSGPPGIAWVIYRLSTDFRQVLSFIVLINVNLAILNLLPLPVLDGGHIVLATVNRFRKKPISGEYIGTLQNIFSVLLLGLMVYVIFFSDVPRLKREWAQDAKDRADQKAAITPDFSQTALPQKTP